MTRVLPLPGPAKIINGPSPYCAASACAGVSDGDVLDVINRKKEEIQLLGSWLSEIALLELPL